MPAWMDRRSSRRARRRPCRGPARSTRTRSARAGRRASAAGAGRRLLARAQQRPLGAVDDVALGDAHVAGEHELLLDDVLDRLDRDVRAPSACARSPTRAASAGRGRGLLERQERLADRDLDLARVPRRDLAVAADQPQSSGAGAERRGHAAQHERPGDVELAGRDEDGLDERRDVVDGDPPRRPAAARDRGGGARRPSAGGGRVGLRLAVRERERRQRVGDDIGHVRGGQRAVVAELDVGHLDRQRGGHVDARAARSARQRGRALELEVLQDLGELETWS